MKKLQLITEAKRTCPDVIIVLGEELGRFRNASKALYNFLESFTWSGKVEKLGFDEVFMDVTDIVDFNQALLNPNNLQQSFFQLKKDDMTVGFPYDATTLAGHVYPQPQTKLDQDVDQNLTIRLILGSYLAQYLRRNLDQEKGYTSTVGISTNKLLSKLVGNMNKPKGQTTLLPPYNVSDAIGTVESNVTTFIDSHDIGKIPGIGFKMAQRIRNHVLSRAPDYDAGLIWGETKESVDVRDVRLYPSMGPEILEQILGGSGAERGIGGKVWGLINGVDDTEVQQAKKVPTQISIEDSYIRLDTIPQVLKELRTLTTSLVNRMHADLLEDDDDPDSVATKRWVAYPKTVRLSTRPRPPLNADGTRSRMFSRISRSAPLPGFVFNLKVGVDATVEKLVQEALVPMFRRLHTQPSGWNLSLVNVCVTNMVEAASADGKGSSGRDIGRMFRRQEDFLKDWKVEDRDVPPDLFPNVNKGMISNRRLNLDEETTTYETLDAEEISNLFENMKNEAFANDYNSKPKEIIKTDPSAGNEVYDSLPTYVLLSGSEDAIPLTQTSFDDEWMEEDDEDEDKETCERCGAIMPSFAMAAHERFHDYNG